VKHVMPLVNSALAQANRRLGRDQDDRGHLWGSGRCKSIPGAGRPDWSMSSPSATDHEDRYVNQLPGDTKVSTKWHPDLRKTNPVEWGLPLRQVQSYGRDRGVRYGFIITDACLVVLRFRQDQIGSGIATTRSTRIVPVPETETTPDARARALSTTSTSSARTTTSSVRSSSTEHEGSVYSDTQSTASFLAPQYCDIPWSNHNKTFQGSTPSGRNPKLTIRLALFYLCLLARYSPNSSIGHDYPPLDSWAKRSAEYVHNSTGATVAVTKLPADATVVELPRSSSSTQSQVGAGSPNNSASRAQSAERGTIVTGTESVTGTEGGVRATRSNVRFAKETAGLQDGEGTVHASIADRSRSGAHSSTPRSGSPGVSALSGHGTTARSSSPGVSALGGHGTTARSSSPGGSTAPSGHGTTGGTTTTSNRGNAARGGRGGRGGKKE
jgi:hypothetical protein